MEYLKSGFKSVLGAQQPGSQPSGAETIERLVDRVNSSTLLDDRRDAVRALKALSKKFRLEVGVQGMDALLNVLETDRNDAEIVGYALDTLCNIMSNDPLEKGDTAELEQENVDLGIQFTEILIKKQDNVSLLLSLLEEYDFHVRWPAVRLLSALLVNKSRDLQEIVLVVPMGISKLMDLLSDSREVIRNDALLLLIYLTKGNANIQKIVAFENAFNRLLDIIYEEGNSDGGIVVEDCLLLLLNLLKNNTSNQNFFKEGSYIQQLTPFLNLQNDSNESGWSAQKVSNIHLMLQVVRTLVSPSNPQQVTSSCQKVMNSCGLLEQLCNILMASGVPADILTETINTVSEVIRGHHANQEYFASVTAPSIPPRPAIVVLLMSMVNEKQPFVLRCAVLYCFQCFLYKNELGQAQIVQTLLPTSADVSSITAGQLLCGGLFSPDPLSTWCAAVALSHALVDNVTQKEQLLRVQLATSPGNPPVSLLQQCSSILHQVISEATAHSGGKVQTRLGLLMLLCTWLSGCPVAVSHFVSIPTNIPYLTSQVALTEGDDQEFLVQGICAFLLGICIQFNDDTVHSFTKDSLCQLIAKRIGLEMFFDKLGQVSKHEAYSRAAQKPQLKYRQSNEVLFDYEFCRLFKSLEGIILKAVTPKPKESLLNGPESNLSEGQHALLLEYKNLIREQDLQLSEMKQKLEDRESELQKTQHQVDEMSSTIQQLKDQISLLKAHRGTQQTTIGDNSELIQLRQETEELKKQIAQFQNDIQEKDKLIQNCNQSDNPTAEESNEAEQTTKLLAEREVHIKSLEEDIQRLKVATDSTQPVSSPESSDTISRLLEEKKIFQERLSKVNMKNQKLEEEKTKLEAEKKSLEAELKNIKKEQDDLLVLLTDQGTKIDKYKHRLKELGEMIEDDDDDDDDDDDVLDVEDDDEINIDS